MEAFKPPGPNGIPLVFFQKFWHIVGRDAFVVIISAFNCGKMLKINFMYITLIPKTIGTNSYAGLWKKIWAAKVPLRSRSGYGKSAMTLSLIVRTLLSVISLLTPTVCCAKVCGNLPELRWSKPSPGFLKINVDDA
ncbi:hypothetical protein FF1_038264 [Malus domestica]